MGLDTQGTQKHACLIRAQLNATYVVAHISQTNTTKDAHAGMQLLVHVTAPHTNA